MTPEHKALVAAGAAMANILYNLTQARAFGSPEIHASMNEAREEWDRCRSAIDSLSAHCAQPQAGEAVAWRYKLYVADVDWTVSTTKPKGAIVEPLYASPQPANPAQVTGEALIERCVEIARDHLEIDGDGESSFVRFDSIDATVRAILAAIGAGGQAVAAVKESLHLTEYEVQVLLGTSIHGCNMSQDRVFSLDMAWHRLHTLDLIDRTDGLAIVTEKGKHVIATILSALSQPHPVDERVVEALRTVRPEIKSETDILKRLADGDEIAFSEDGDEAFFTKGDRAFVGPVIISMRSKGYLKRIVLNDENYRGTAERDVISDAGIAALAQEGRNG